jgi:CheY-like chemotaxis protein
MADNNTILLLGYSDDFFDSLKNELALKYYVRAPKILLGLKDDLESGSRPLAIVAYLQSMGANDFVILNKLLKDTMSDLPMIIIGTQNECGVFCNHVASDRRFRLIMPITVADVHAAIEKCREENALTDPTKKILVADRDRLMLATLRGYLHDNYSVRIVASGHDALEAAKKNRPDLILLNYSLPDMNGAGFVAALQDNCATATIPFIFLTEDSDRNTVLECLKLKPAGFLVKPLDKANLLSTVEGVLAAPEEAAATPRPVL